LKKERENEKMMNVKNVTNATINLFFLTEFLAYFIFYLFFHIEEKKKKDELYTQKIRLKRI